MQPDTCNRPTLAVTLPIYNHAALLPRALDALLNQSRLPDELILLDDGSTDSTWEVIQDYANRYSFIRPVRYERNRGAVHGANHMLQLVRCAYVYCAAADDYVLPGFFENAMRLAEAHPEAGVVFGGVDFFVASANETYPLRISAWEKAIYAAPERVLSQWLRQLPAEHSFSPAMVYRLEALKSVGGFRPELGPWVDNFAIQSIALKYGACYSPRACVVFNVNPHGFSGKSLSDFRLAMRVIDHLVGLMTSTEFTDRFPRDYVAWWSREYRRYLVSPQVHLLLHHARRFWVQLAQLCFVPNAKGLALQLTIQGVIQWIGRRTWRKNMRG